MLYIQQSLNPNEEIVRVGHFHWWYTFSAALSILFGFLFMCAIVYAGYYQAVTDTVGQFVPGTNFMNVKDSGYWDAAIDYNGGVLNTVRSMHIGFKIAAVVALLFGLLAFAQKMIIKASTEICLTNDRLVLKRGLVARHVAEISVDRIEGVDVYQGIIARMFGFGFVSVRGMGVGEVVLPQIADPVDFRKAIDRARSMDKNIDGV